MVSEVNISRNPSDSEEAELSLAARDALREFSHKWTDLLSDLDNLPQPVRSIACFVKEQAE